jgi:hypothetical protein
VLDDHAVERGRPPLARVEAEERAEALRAPRAHQPGDPEDLPAVERQAHALGHVFAAQVADDQQRPADLVRRPRVHLVHLAADHRLDDHLARESGVQG